MRKPDTYATTGFYITYESHLVLLSDFGNDRRTVRVEKTQKQARPFGLACFCGGAAGNRTRSGNRPELRTRWIQ